MIRPIHPFPARMAPDLALSALSHLKASSLVLDPMVGSGTVVRQASQLGHSAIGFDVDPLAVLMATVWTTPIERDVLSQFCRRTLKHIKATRPNVRLSWIDEDEEMVTFIDYWFGARQQKDLRRIGYVLERLNKSRIRGTSRAALNFMRLALSRIIITKTQGASLAHDISHSRPHRVMDESSFEVVPAFEKALANMQRLLSSSAPPGNVKVDIGDSRSLSSIDNRSIDAVLTSPPYLNAIDYMRGHKLSLVWLGHRLSDLRKVRTTSIGAERCKNDKLASLFEDIQGSMCDVKLLTARHAGMTLLYAEDIYRFTSEIARVLRPGGRAILVVGNSCLKGTFVKNSHGVACAASATGLKLIRQVERELPAQHRYLPMPKSSEAPLGRRMRTETVLTFKHR